MNTFNTYSIPAVDRFFRSPKAVNEARTYVGERNADALKLCAELCFKPYPHGALLCQVYGHTIHLHGAGGVFYEKGSAVPLLFEHIAQPLAYLLAKNW